MKQFWFKTLWGILTVAGLSMGMFPSTRQARAYQSAPTPTRVFITVANPPDGTNVRSGPSSVAYGPPIGHLNPGDTAPAIGKSPGGDWVQIEFPSGPNGTGWVYSVNVVVSGGELRIVEPPPSPAPLITATIDPTLAAAFNIQPTQTRMPTFTPPPPLEIPQFADENTGRSFGASGIFIVGLGLIGGIGLLVSYILRK
ncbi:MAG TPA: SH3 domain-containing protein [Anaerolineales bacterium]